MENNGVFYIIGAGEYKNNEIKINDGDFVCACDGGYKIAIENNIKVDLLIGDFDSLDFVPNNVKVIRLNPIKDDTDVFAAINEGIKLGFDTFYIYGATGKREEHTIANIQILHYLAKNNLNGKLVNNKKIYEVLHNETKSFNDKMSGYFSMFSLSDTSIVTLKNFKYNVTNYTLANSFPLGIDNEFIGKESSIEVKDGFVLIIYSLK